MRAKTGVGALLALLLAATPPTAAGADDGPDAGSVWRERRVLSVAHAGGDLEAPHSTPFAFARAVSEGADVLEMDVRLSADGVLVVHHDETVDRITNGTGRVDEMTVAELQALDAAYWFVPGCWSCHSEPPEAYVYRGVRTGDVPPPPGFEPDDFVIPTLRQILERFPDRVLDIEIKGSYPDDEPTAIALAELLAEYGRTDDVVVASFDDDLLAAFSARAPQVPTSPGLARTAAWFLGGAPLDEFEVLQLPPTYAGIPIVTPDSVAAAHAAGLAVWVWFEGDADDRPETYQALLDAGVDGLISGKPRLVQQTLTAQGATFRVAFGAPDRSVVARGRRVEVPLACPARGVARCRGVALALVAHPRRGADLVGVVAVEATPGDVARFRVRLPRRVVDRLRRLGPQELRIVVWPVGDDTAVTDTTIEVRRPSRARR